MEGEGESVGEWVELAVERAPPPSSVLLTLPEGVRRGVEGGVEVKLFPPPGLAKGGDGEEVLE